MDAFQLHSKLLVVSEGTNVGEVSRLVFLAVPAPVLFLSEERPVFALTLEPHGQIYSSM